MIRPRFGAPALDGRGILIEPMRPRRGYLFWGIFFILLGGIPLAARQGWIDASRWGEIGRLWPLIIIAVGVVILLSRTQLALVGTIVAAIVLGGVAGAALAGGSRFGDCLPGGPTTLAQTSESGSLSGPSSVDLQLVCGSLDLAGVRGARWSIDASYRATPPQITATGTSLTVRTPQDSSRRQEWKLTVPTDRLERLRVQSNAAEATLNVSGVALASLEIEANAGDVSVFAGEGSIGRLRVIMNAGRARLTLAEPLDGGQLSVNAGAIDLCVPPTAELSLDVAEQLTFATNLEDRHLTKSGTGWHRAGSGGPTIALKIEGNAASFTLNPSGGCR
jgi:hypothetical protein